MKKLLIIITFINLAGLVAGGFALKELKKDQDNFGATATIPKAVALFETSLASSVTGSATTATLATGTDKEGTSLSGTYGFIIDEGSSNEEFVLCTASGTALTACSRGLSVTAPASASAALQKTHRRGASVKITDWPLIGTFQRLLDGTDEFPATLTYASSVAACSANDDICDKAYIDGVAIAGAPNAGDATRGIVEQATVAEINADGDVGSTTARLFINPSRLASSNYFNFLPTTKQKDALTGSLGTPSTTNKYITMQDVASVSFATTASRSDWIIRSDGDSVPSALWIDATKLTTAASAQGDILYRNATGYTRLGPGTSGQFLKTQGASANPIWATPASTSFSTTQVFTGTSPTTGQDLDLSSVVGAAQRVALLKTFTPSGTTVCVFAIDGGDVAAPVAGVDGANISSINTTTAVETYIIVKTSAAGIVDWNCTAGISDYVINVIAYW